MNDDYRQRYDLGWREIRNIFAGLFIALGVGVWYRAADEIARIRRRIGFGRKRSIRIEES